MRTLFREYVIVCALILCFLHPGSAVEEALPKDGDLLLDRVELRSIVRLPGGWMFGLKDPEMEQGFWIEIGEIRHGLEAVAFEAEENRLLLRQGDATRTVGLSGTRIRPPGETRARLDREVVRHSPEVEEFLYQYLGRRMEQVDRDLFDAIGDTEGLVQIDAHYRAVVEELLGVELDRGARDPESEEGERLTRLMDEINEEYVFLRDNLSQAIIREGALTEESRHEILQLHRSRDHLVARLREQSGRLVSLAEQE